MSTWRDLRNPIGRLQIHESIVLSAMRNTSVQKVWHSTQYPSASQRHKSRTWALRILYSGFSFDGLCIIDAVHLKTEKLPESTLK